MKEEKGMEGLDDLAHHLDFDASWIKHELLEEDFEPDNFKHELIIKSEPSDQVWSSGNVDNLGECKIIEFSGRYRR